MSQTFLVITALLFFSTSAFSSDGVVITCDFSGVDINHHGISEVKLITGNPGTVEFTFAEGNVDFHMANTSFSTKKPLNNTTYGSLTAQYNTTYLDLTAV